MKHPNAAASPDDPRDAAAAWFARLHSDAVTEADRRAFEQWRSAHPEHARQYRSVQQIWDASLHIPEHEWRALLARRAAPASRARPVRRRLALGLAGACSVALVGGIALGGGRLAEPLQTVDIAAQRGQRRQLTLPDGSTLDVNTGTQAQARLYRNKRVVELLQGEIFFSVQHDAGRPFTVEAGDSRVRVTGTRFNVRHDAQATQVSVTAGAVQVSNGSWWRRRARPLAAGQSIRMLPQQGLGTVGQPDLDTVLAWQRGKIVFENTPLAQAVAEINRYLERPALLEAPALRNYRIAGIFSIDDPQALLETLPEIAPVHIYHRQNGQPVIVAR